MISVCPPPQSSSGDDLHSRIKVESESISREQHKRENVPLTPLSGRPDRLSWSSNAVAMTRILGPLLPNRSPGFAACVPAGADRAGMCSRRGRVAACLLLRGSREDGHPVPPPWSRAARAPGTGRRTRCPRPHGGASRHPDSPRGAVPSRSKVRSRDFCPREPLSLVLAFRKVLE